MGKEVRHLKVTAIRIRQRPDVPMFIFAMGGTLLPRVFAVDSVKRTAEGTLTGYQRSRVSGHIGDIRRYLMSTEALLPNAIVVSLDRDAVTFQAFAGRIDSDWGSAGTLAIRMPGLREAKPGLVIDGQQRMSAFASLPVERNMPVVVVGFVAASEAMQREQFVLVNRSRPLPRDLLNELLPRVDTALPPNLQRRRTAAQVLEHLRFDPDSVFHGRIRGVGSDGAGATISQAALLAVIEASLRAGYLHREATTDGVVDVDKASQMLKIYYAGVARVWPHAWGGSSWSSRLVHGVGIYAIGRLMEDVLPSVNWDSSRAVQVVSRRLGPLKDACAWTAGSWPTLNCGWNGLQNTSQDKRRLALYLREAYLSARAR